MTRFVCRQCGGKCILLLNEYDGIKPTNCTFNKDEVYWKEEKADKDKK